MQLMTRKTTEDRPAASLVAQTALAVMRVMRSSQLGHHIFDDQHHAYFGSVWFGVHRATVAYLVNRFDSPDIQTYFCRLSIAEKFLIPTLLKGIGARHGLGNHLVNAFINANSA